MIEHIATFLPDGKPYKEYHVGEDGVKKIFFDREDKETLVITTEENIVTLRGFLYVALKAYKVQEA